MTIELGMVQTLAPASLVLFAGYGIRRRVNVLDRHNIPAPVIGGFLFAAIALVPLRLHGRRLLHRRHQRAHHHDLHQSGDVSAFNLKSEI
ncbi:MAG: hypothetical protein HYX76_13940 [Acidobacteria bacterium]|nr:hypothetical protein [Acidobacteriota bacterium]